MLTIDWCLFILVLEFMAGGIFLHYLRKNGTKLDKKKLIKFSIDAAAGMEYLGNNNCIHRDVAARNCLIDAHDLLKISDFRMARQVDQGKVLMTSYSRVIFMRLTRSVRSH